MLILPAEGILGSWWRAEENVRDRVLADACGKRQSVNESMENSNFFSLLPVLRSNDMCESSQTAA
jgi:hypothetical protein